jgi:hypothetical protein
MDTNETLGVLQFLREAERLKLGETQGQIALWIGAGTEAYFSNVVVRSAGGRRYEQAKHDRIG